MTGGQSPVMLMVLTKENGERYCWNCARDVDTEECILGYICPYCGFYTERPDEGNGGDEMVNFITEFGKIGEPDKKEGKYFKPKPGNKKVTFLDNGTEQMIKFHPDEPEKKVVKFKVKVDGEEMEWTVTPPEILPYSKATLYGQLVICGKEWNGLESKTVTLMTTNNGKRNVYMVYEAGEIVERMEKDAKKEMASSGISIMHSMIRK